MNERSGRGSAPIEILLVIVVTVRLASLVAPTIFQDVDPAKLCTDVCC